MENFWNQRYDREEYVYGTSPSTFFGKKLWDQKFGRLLLPGEGEGRNAVYAARKGWLVHAFDYSTVGAAKAIKLSRKEQVRFEYQISDTDSFEIAEDYYHLISVSFLHLLPEERRIFHRNMLLSLLPGGKIILEYFSKKQIDLDTGGPRNLNMLYDPEELKNDFEGAEILELHEEKVLLNEGLFHQGEAWVIRMECKKPE
jgi:hypothetical protein